MLCIHNIPAPQIPIYIQEQAFGINPASPPPRQHHNLVTFRSGFCSWQSYNYMKEKRDIELSYQANEL